MLVARLQTMSHHQIQAAVLAEAVGIVLMVQVASHLKSQILNPSQVKSNQPVKFATCHFYQKET